MGTKGTSKRKEKPRGLKVYPKHLPHDVFEIASKRKHEAELNCKCPVGFEQTIYTLIREGAK